ncbi:hypothetical protein HELRODRAFT_99303 [Helobdella robusta]|uniref:tRNA pseudouridine synthase n=1 Tax=Helobdella robusta TaxID=6412 RepID=T1G9S1_HELRO|nr:hypothetical protein HELRODRAFT_99303 [Helobdella robusta]ESO04967.1 hypothetical protein HELRODRAFT_99303 [Helobdella robusta]
MLNKVLPSDIRVIAWTPVRDDFSARFDCKQRTYRYFFPKGTLNIKKMRIASSYLIGQHDFRNLCKMDVANGVVNFVRNISDVRLAPFSSNQRLPSPIKKSSSSTTTMEDNSTTTTDQTDQSYNMYVLTIVSQAFLWHQIRCIMAVLLLVGEEAEEPEIVKDLLDVSTYPNKPQYSMASEIPLVLYECEYDDITWIIDEVNMQETVSTLQSKWSEMSIKSTMLRAMLEDISSTANVCITSQSNMLLPGNKPKVYKPLLSRPTCESLEDRINYHNRKRKLKTLCESD